MDRYATIDITVPRKCSGGFFMSKILAGRYIVAVHGDSQAAGLFYTETNSLS